MGSLTGKQDQAYQRGQANPEEKGAYSGNSAIASGLPMLGNIDNSQPYDFNGVVASMAEEPAMVKEFNVSDPMVEEPNKLLLLARDMIRDKATLSDLSPEQRAYLEEGDKFVHLLSQNIISKNNNREEAQEDITGMLHTLGFDMGELNSRASAVNRFANGVADTAASVYNGINNLVGQPDELAGDVANRSDAQADADSKLHSSLNIGRSWTDPRELTGDTDIATTIGKAAPSMAMSMGVGSVAQMAAKPALKTVAGLQAGADVGLEALREHGTEEGIEPKQLIVNALAGVLGYKMTPKGGAKVTTANKELMDSISEEDWLFSDAPITKALVESAKTNKASGSFGANIDDIKDVTKAQAKAWAKNPMFDDLSKHMVKIKPSKVTEDIKALIVKSNTPKDMLKNISKSDTVPKKFSTWASTMLREQGKEKGLRWGANALFLLGHMPSGAILSIITSPTAKNLAKKAIQKAKPLFQGTTL